jgi:hypothetical protein
LLGEGGRRQIAKTGLLSLPVVKDLDIFGDGLSSLSACREPAVMHEFVFERPPEVAHVAEQEVGQKTATMRQPKTFRHHDGSALHVEALRLTSDLTVRCASGRGPSERPCSQH